MLECAILHGELVNSPVSTQVFSFCFLWARGLYFNDFVGSTLFFSTKWGRPTPPRIFLGGYIYIYIHMWQGPFGIMRPSPLFYPTRARTSLSLSLAVLLSGCFCGHILSSSSICFHTCLPCSLQVVASTPSPLLFFSQAALTRMDFLAFFMSLFLSSFVQVSLLVSKLLCFSRCALGWNLFSVKLPSPPSLPHVTLLDDFRVLKRGWNSQKESQT